MRLRPLFFALLLGLFSAGAASAQVVISAQIGNPYYGRPYYAPRSYGYYPPVAAPAYYAQPPVYYAPAPVYYAPQPRYYAPAPYYGRGYGRGYSRGYGRRW